MAHPQRGKWSCGQCPKCNRWGRGKLGEQLTCKSR